MNAIRRIAGAQPWRRSPRTRQGGQGLIEFAMIVPVFMLLLLGLLEFGFIFDHTMTISYATREGARSGAAFAAGNTTTMVCTTSVDVDKYIVAAAQRVLDAPGSRVPPSDIQTIKIYRASSTGVQIGTQVNVWTYLADSGPLVDGQKLDFISSSSGWNACARDSTWTAGVAPDSIGVSITYNYHFVTPLAAALGFFGPPGSSTLPISDRTVMALNPQD